MINTSTEAVLENWISTSTSTAEHGYKDTTVIRTKPSGPKLAPMLKCGKDHGYKDHVYKDTKDIRTSFEITVSFFCIEKCTDIRTCQYVISN